MMEVEYHLRPRYLIADAVALLFLVGSWLAPLLATGLARLLKYARGGHGGGAAHGARSRPECALDGLFLNPGTHHTGGRQNRVLSSQ